MVGAGESERGLYYYTRAANGEIESTMIGTASVDLPQALERPALGASVSERLTPTAAD